ncbi:virulence protein RhuM/Fic/DOC family protein [Catalinimonas sp. 4WD22]|uniref:virulence protein RhuM/Fic/DOC family protein n=1 Tax=Catalinimonas locisalis TaxID=3133978 RepID=UPI0031019678
MNSDNPIEIFATEDGSTEIKVHLQQDTVWLSQAQMETLFDKSKKTISEHINNVFKEGELEPDQVVRKFRTTAADGKTYQVNHYNLDVIISVGYRVKSKRGTQFRIWATNVLRQYLVEGYALNQKRLLEQQQAQMNKLQQAIRMISEMPDRTALFSDEAASILKVLQEYSYALDILDQYDHQSVEVQHTQDQETYRLTYEEARAQIDQWRNHYGAGKLFGNEKDESFKSSIDTIYQTFDGIDLYPSVEEKAAHLLYFIVKNHSFSDGNKRIAAGIFVWFLDKNRMLYKSDGSKRIADNALVALTLMIAESKADEKELIINVVVNLINKQN